MAGVSVFSPAKINLLLAVTGKRGDGFHDIVSLVAPVAFGDDILVEVSAAGMDELHCSDQRVPTDASNLILRTAERFREESGISENFRFRLEKRIPMGGGFGGGSSNAVAALKAMNQLFSHPLDPNEMHRVASEMGSDCPLFLSGHPVVMRGRGEEIEKRPDLKTALNAWKIGIFDPGFHSSTASLFQFLAKTGDYISRDSAENELQLLITGLSDGGLDQPTLNSFSKALRDKFLFYDLLFEEISTLGNIVYGITGSGSGCFVLFRKESELKAMRSLSKRLFGREGFMIETEFLTLEDMPT